jgi:muconate cycloisomerase
MRIAELTAYHVRIPLLRRIRHASHTRDENDTLVVCCRLDDGTEGWGEGLPRPYVTGETIDTALEHLRQSHLPQQLGGSFSDLAGAVALCDRLKLIPEGTDGRGCFGHAARCAVEIAVLDAVGRATDRPLSDVTSLVPETLAIRQSADRVRYSAAVTAMHSFRVWVRAWKIKYYKFRQVKMKVGVADVDDAALLTSFRKVVGPDVDIRVDANEAWTCDNLEARWEPLRPFGITSLEQPVPHAQVDGLAALRPRLGVPIMLDESLCSLTDAQRSIERGTCDLFNIRLSKCGGFVNSLKLAAMANGAGLGFQLGCQVGETGILSAAGRHFACSVAGIRYLEGSFDRFLVGERLTKEDLTFGRGGWAPALPKPGLGVTIDRGAVTRVTVREEHWKFV